jgi:hypothetical protein
MTTITQDRLKTLLDYDPETGVFTRKVSVSNARADREAGGLDRANGYVRIRLDGVRYKAHLLAWLYQYGCWPLAQVDHINRVRHDNRIANLRLVTPAQNAQNRKLQRNNASGHRGVYWHRQRNKWAALIAHQHKSIHLGVYDTFQDAVNARLAAEKRFFTHSPVAHANNPVFT